MEQGKVYVIGDIHGAYKALMQCLKKSNFDYQKDKLICLGDVSDGWPETGKCIDEFLKMDNLIYILGNHDTWTLNWMLTGEIPDSWLYNGGQATIDSFTKLKKSQIEFLQRSHEYYLEDNRLFVHGGIRQNMPLEDQSKEVFFWDRSLFREAMSLSIDNKETQLTEFDEIYIGHTPIHRFG